MTTRTTPVPSALDLQYPMPLGVYEDYAEAQRIVGYLAEREFPVQNVAIVGTELRSVERVTGRLTRGKLAAAGALSGLWAGLFVGLAFTLLGGYAHPGFLIVIPLLGALFGMIWSQLGFRAVTRGGKRDFASVSQVEATRYEVLVEHRWAAHARQLLDADQSPRVDAPAAELVSTR